jgi:hypothetical protein
MASSTTVPAASQQHKIADPKYVEPCNHEQVATETVTTNPVGDTLPSAQIDDIEQSPLDLRSSPSAEATSKSDDDNDNDDADWVDTDDSDVASDASSISPRYKVVKSNFPESEQLREFRKKLSANFSCSVGIESDED